MEILDLSTHKRTQKCLDFQAAISEKDRISQLPDDILHHILSFLTATDIVRTSALSTRWQPLSSLFTISDLNFCFENIYYLNFTLKEWTKENPIDYLDKFCKTKLPDRVRLFNLKLKRPVDDVSVKMWVDNLLKHKLEELHLLIHSQKLFRIPDNLSNSQSLTSLSLQMESCTLIVPHSICFPRLKTLYLGYLKFEYNHSFQRLLSGCLVLEDLQLWGCHWMDVSNITISIPSLVLKDMLLWDCHLRGVGNITISNPSLQKLTITGMFASEVVLLNLSSLTDAKLYLSYCETHSALALLAGLLGAKSLTLSIEVLEAISSTEDLLAHLPTFHNLTHLEVSLGLLKYSVIGALVSILQKSSNLQALICGKSVKIWNV